MPAVIEVSFKGNRKEFFLWNSEELPSAKAGVIVEADRGEDLGFVHATGDLAERRLKGVPHAPGEEGVTRAAQRLATVDELHRLQDLREQDESARRKAAERVRVNNLGMKISDAEWRWDRRKLTLYFTAEKRVDFRTLVRELASMFRTRIELKQIGVRDEAKRLGGIGRCGREYCSATWLPELRPVNLGVAKDQRLSLNPSQISGACGRLMCCLRYEHEFYVQQRKRFPKEGKTVTTANGEEKVVSNDIFRERVTLRNAEGEYRTIELADLRRDMGGGPVSIESPPADDESSGTLEGLSDEVIRLQDTQEIPAWMPRPGGTAKSQGPNRTRRLRVVVASDDAGGPDAPPAPAPMAKRVPPTPAPAAKRVPPPTAAPAPPTPPTTAEAEGLGTEPGGGDRRRRGRRGGRGRRRGGGGGSPNGERGGDTPGKDGPKSGGSTPPSA